MITDRPHITVGADEILEVTDGVRESNVFKGKHVIDHPELLEGFQLIGDPRMFLMHQRKRELEETK